MSPRKAASKRAARTRKAAAGGRADNGDSGDDRAPGVRPFWSGTLTFGLVSVPVALYPAVRSGRVSLRMLDEDGTPLERRYFDPETGRDVAGDRIVRGYQTEKGKFVVVEDEELEAIAPEKTRDIDLRRFVPLDQLDPLYFERAYFLLPGGESVKAYRLLAATMEETGRAGIATFVMRGIEYLTAITAENGVLRAQTLRFQNEVRTPKDVGLASPKKAPPAEVARLTRAIRSRSKSELAEKELVDGWAERLEKLVARKKKKGKDVVDVPEEELGEDTGAKVIDLLEVLKRSMAESASGKTERKPPLRAAAKKTSSKSARAKKSAGAKRKSSRMRR
jgi:DNA end-binding protein Ku